jgi:hypothetical protein
LPWLAATTAFNERTKRQDTVVRCKTTSIPWGHGVFEVLLYVYLAGWALTTLGLVFTVDRIQEPRSPQRHPLPMALAAGATWPLLILGAAEYATVAVAAAAVHGDDHALTVTL